MAEAQRQRVLVVSDDPFIREEAKFGFPQEIDVELAWDAREALTLARAQIPSVVVVDIRTGSAGGFSLSRELKQVTALENVPVLMLLEREQDSWLAKQAGAVAYRTKPLDTTLLVEDALSLVANP